MEDVKRVAQKYLPKILDPLQSFTAITCGPEEVGEAKEVMESFGFDMEEISDVKNSFLSQL